MKETLAFLLLLFSANVSYGEEEPFLKFPGVFYGDDREATEEEAKLYSFVEQEAASPSRYISIGNGQYLVKIESVLIVSGVYLANPTSGLLNKIVGGDVEVVKEVKAKTNVRWFLILSGGVRHGRGWSSYYAIIINSDAYNNLIVSELGSVEYDVNKGGEDISYVVYDENGDGFEDIVFHTRQKDREKDTVKKIETTYLFGKSGFYKKP